MATCTKNASKTSNAMVSGRCCRSISRSALPPNNIASFYLEPVEAHAPTNEEFAVLRCITVRSKADVRAAQRSRKPARSVDAL
jgi:hypothetical protein